jgi:hypothetical protein
LTIDQFRAHPTLPSDWAKELRESTILQIVLGVLEENHPARFTIQGDNDGDLSPTRAAVELGVTRGYSKFGDTLRLLAQRKIKQIDVGEPTYSKEEEKVNGW